MTGRRWRRCCPIGSNSSSWSEEGAAGRTAGSGSSSSSSRGGERDGRVVDSSSGGARNWLGETIQVLRAAADELTRDGRDGQDHRAAASAGGARAVPGPAAGRSEL